MLFKSDNESIELRVLRRNNSNTEDFWDANWLQAEVQIHLLSFKATCGLMVTVDDFQAFLKQLVSLKSGESSSAVFNTTEGEFYLELTSEHTGRLLCEGFVISQANKLQFNISVERQCLDSSIRRVEAILKQYPCIGTPY